MEKQFNDFAYQVFAGRQFAIPDARLGWEAGVQAERERIKEIVIDNVKAFHTDAFAELLERIDAPAE